MRVHFSFSKGARNFGAAPGKNVSRSNPEIIAVELERKTRSVSQRFLSE